VTLGIDPRYPDITVPMSGEDGHTGAIMGRVTAALRRGGVPASEIDEFRAAVFDCESYDAVLQLVMKWVEVT
jgi:hypothetical protein